MTTSTCYTSLQLCALRVAKLTTAGAPLTGAGNGYVTDATIQLGITLELEDGDDFTQKNGCGNICATYRAPDTIKNIAVAMELCQLDAVLIAMLTGGTVITSGSAAVGFKAPPVGESPGPVAIEAWSKAWDGEQQAVNAFTSPDETYFHWVFPYVRFVPGDFTLENGLLVVPVNGIGQENSNLSVDGPYDDWPVAVANSGGFPTLFGWYLDGELPTIQCEDIAVTSDS